MKGRPSIHRHQEDSRKLEREASKSENRNVKRKYGLITEIHPVQWYLVKIRADSGEMIGGIADQGAWIPLEGGEMLTQLIGRPRPLMRVVVEYTGEAVLSGYARIISPDLSTLFESIPTENDKEVGAFSMFTPPAF